MSNLEKLFIQLFERKNWIIDQVKQQNELHGQHLASKLLINGILPPPSWLGNAGTADLTELNKQDLISGLLNPPLRSKIPSTSDHCTFYSKPAAKSYNGPTSDSVFMDTCASNKYFEAGDRLTVLPKCHLNENEKLFLNGPCELGPTIASPQDQTSVKASDSYVEPVQSLARIQRSKSRQKALELRNSGKAQAEMRSSKEGNCSVYSGRVTRSRTACQQPITVKELLELNKASDVVDDNDGRAPQTKTEKCPSSGLKNAEGFSEANDSKIPRARGTWCRSVSSDKPSQIAKESKCVEGHDLKEVSGSQVDILPCSDASGNVAETDHVSNEPAEACPSLRINCARGFSQSNNSSKISSGRVRRSKFASTDKPCQLAQPLNWVEGGNLQKASEGQVDILPCNDVPETVNEENGIAETEHVLSVPVQPCSIHSQSNMHGASHRDGLEILLQRLPSESAMLLEPKELVFDDVEVCNLTDGVDPMEKGTQGRSLEIRSFCLLGPAESLEKVGLAESLEEAAISDVFHKKCDTSMDELLVQKEMAKEVVNREKEGQRAYSEAEAGGRNEFIEVEKSGCDYYVTSIGKTSKSPAMSSRNATSKTCEDAVLDKSAEINKTLNQICCLTDDLITRQVGQKSPAGSQVQKVLDSSLPGVDVDSQADSSGKKCNEELDIGPGYNLFRESGMLLRSQETRVSCVVGKGATKSFLCQMAAADSPEMGNAEIEPPYYLRSSNSRDKNVGSSKLSGSIIAKKSIISAKTKKNDVECSWPQSKRRKLEGRSSNALTASGRLRRGKPLQQIREETEYRYLESVENGAEAVSEVQDVAPCEMNIGQPNAVASPVVQMHEKESFHKVECLESPTKSQVKEGEPVLEGREQSAETTLTCNDKHMESSLDYSLRNEVSGYLQSSFWDKVVMEKQPSIALNLTKESTGEDCQNLLPCESILNLGSTENMSCTDETMLETHLEDLSSLSYCLVSSPFSKDVDLINADQTMPEFEGFSIGEPTANDLPCIAENGSGFDHSDLLSTSIGQDNILEQLYRSSSMLTPLPNASTTYKVHSTPDIYQSLPNGLEQMNLRNSALFNADENKQVNCSYNGVSEEVDNTFLGRSYSDFMSSSSVQFSWDVTRPPCTPPVGKICWKNTAKASNDSLQKRESINPSLTCFRIEEDPIICEENGDGDEMVDSLKEGIQMRVKNCSTKMEPLADVTNENFDPSASVSLADKSVERGSLDSVNAGFKTSQTKMDAKQKLKSFYGTQRKYKNKDTENKWSSLGSNGSWKATESQIRCSKPKLSGKVSEGKGGQSLLEKGSKHNNIVSNISSFIPFVQQKQPAGAFTGKKDIKVKALEAAEAAKRLEEKRENERKMKKEAAKLERARLEQENMRQLELRQRKKEEERKKKEADLAARKRLREEEERKEKARKRKCIEEARRQQREHEERLRVEKEEKEIRRRAADKRECKRNEPADEARKLQKMGKSKEVSDLREMTHTELRTAMVSACDAREASDFHRGCQAPKSDETEKEICNLNEAHEDVLSTAEGSLEQTYSISPYQESGDEEEEEDDMPNQKFIPSWASENCLAQILPTLKKVDPDGIFPPSSFCSISEVILPRKQQLR